MSATLRASSRFLQRRLVVPPLRSVKRCVLFCPERQLAVPPTDSRMLKARHFSFVRAEWLCCEWSRGQKGRSGMRIVCEPKLKCIARFVKFFRLFAWKRVHVSEVKSRVSGAPLFMNFKVGGSVFACDVTVECKRIKISFFKRTSAGIKDDSVADAQPQNFWSSILQKPTFAKCKIEDYTRHNGGWRIVQEFPCCACSICIAWKIVCLIRNF